MINSKPVDGCISLNICLIIELWILSLPSPKYDKLFIMTCSIAWDDIIIRVQDKNHQIKLLMIFFKMSESPGIERRSDVTRQFKLNKNLQARSE